MNKPLSFYLGWRMMRSKYHQAFVSFAAITSMLGIALGVTVLITVLSIMNGFDQAIRDKFFSMLPEATIVSSRVLPQNLSTQTVNSTLDAVLNTHNIRTYWKHKAPYVEGQSVLSHKGVMQGLDIMGIDPKYEKDISDLTKNIVSGQLTSLTPGGYHLLIGKQLSDNLHVGVGDSVILLAPDTHIGPLGFMPRYRRFTVTAIFNSQEGLGLESSRAYIALADAKRFLAPEQSTTGWHIRLYNPYLAQHFSALLQPLLPQGHVVTTWVQAFGAFFQSLNLEKRILWFVLSLIIVVSAFNLTATLVMVIHGKRGDIAVLRTLGATPGFIMRLIIAQGLIIAVLGAAIGTVGGVLLATHVTAVSDALQHFWGVKLLDSSFYLLHYLPSKLLYTDVLSVFFITVVLSLLATLYPAWYATTVSPARTLRYE